jgi:uncharacterized protein (TIGR01244 family)
MLRSIRLTHSLFAVALTAFHLFTVAAAASGAPAIPDTRGAGQAAPPAVQQSAVAPQAPASGSTIPGIRNFTRVNDRVSLGGGVEKSAYPLLKQAGFVTIVNLRTAEEAGADIEGSMAAAKEAGLVYIHLPFVNARPDGAKVYEFLKVVSDPASQPVLLHCAAAGRASIFWAIKRVLQDGWTVEKAMGEFPNLTGMVGEPVRAFALSYVKAHSRQ